MTHNSSRLLKNVSVLCMTLMLVFGKSGLLYAQANEIVAPEVAPINRPQAPMKNVMLNVFWGAGLGAILMVGLSTLDDSVPTDERFGFTRLSEHMLTGATYGGLIGLGVGVILSIQGITFDPNMTRIADGAIPELDHNEYHLKNYHTNKKIANGLGLKLFDFDVSF